MGITSAVHWVSSPSARLVRRLAVASLVANLLIVATGGAVRLTGSGLGCPKWPQCSAGSFVAHRALGIHGAIEFGNRLLTVVLALVAVATWVAVWRYRPAPRSARVLALLLLLGIPAQALLGGVTVLTDLNPWIVAWHFLLSMAVIAAAFAFWRAAGGGTAAAWAPPPALRWLATATAVAGVATVVLGTVVTGSGPHAGDADAARTGFDPATVSQLHADAVLLLVGLTVAVVLWLRAVDAPAGIRRAAAVLLAVELAQGLIGFVQYFTGLPVLLVGAHLLGACLVWMAAVRLLLSITERSPAGPAQPAAAAPAPDRADAGAPQRTSASTATATNSSAR